MRRARQRGFTLIEMIIGLLIVSVVSIALAGTFLVGYRTLSREASEISADQAVGNATLWLTRDLGSATTVATGSISAGSGSLQVTYGSPSVTVTYTINNQAELVRAVGTANFVAARGMQSLAVTAAGPACYLSVAIQPSATGATTQTLNVGERPGGCF